MHFNVEQKFLKISLDSGQYKGRYALTFLLLQVENTPRARIAPKAAQYHHVV